MYNYNQDFSRSNAGLMNMVSNMHRASINKKQIPKKVPKECYEQFGNDLDACSTQENEGCGRCPLYK